jgi:phosphotriesterase-related protein
MTVRGPISPRDLGMTLTHEHALANFHSYEEQKRNPLTYDQDEVMNVVLPHLMRLRELGCRTFVDATATFLGRDAALLRRLSEESGLHILTVSGNYAAIEKRHLPPHAFTDAPDALAQRWVNEWEQGIEGTGVYPGFIKLGFGGGPLDAVERNLIRAGAIAHLKTGLTIGAHTGPAVSALEQLEELEKAGVDASAWIWIHAQNEKDLGQQTSAARRGAWISFDGVGPDSVDAHVQMVKRLRDEALLHRVLVSQDAGWYTVGEPRGGKLRSYETIFTSFIPALRTAGFSSSEIDKIFIENPAAAFSVGVRAT